MVYLGALQKLKTLGLVQVRPLTASAAAGKEAHAPGSASMCLAGESDRDLYNQHHTLLPGVNEQNGHEISSL